jgi:two-component system phosphate regulon sensor histidine kinase PhoR
MENNELVNRAEDEILKMRKEFSANVSHELKTPLTSISGYAEIMKSGMVNREDMIAFSERIYNEASRMITLIDDIIKLSKLDEESMEVEWEDVDLYELSHEIIDRLAMSAKKRSVQVELQGEPVVYYGVRQMLDEMIFNLCENAIKYNVPDGKVTIWVGNCPEGIKVVVEDTGIGIPKDQQERVFERFYRVDKSHSKKTGGTGLGLSIVKHAAIYHHAQIHVDSEVGKGTRMEVLFVKVL